MTAALSAAGAALVLLALLDAITTTLTAGSGGGPLTARLTRGLWRALLGIATGGRSRLLSYAGMLTLLSTVALWVILLWAGWSLIFSADERAVVHANTGSAASLPARIYYAGFVVFTLGVGDFVPGSGPWQVTTAVASFLGLFIITLSITYLISVVSAAVTRRRLAMAISILGDSGADIVAVHWNDDRLSAELSSRIQALTSQILQTTQQHLAYPVLHYFHSPAKASSAPYALAALDDALLILSEGISGNARPEAAVLTPLRRALEHYGDTVNATGGSAAGAPPLPALRHLRANGLPVVADGEFQAAAETHRQRREAMHSLVRSDSWRWPLP